MKGFQADGVGVNSVNCCQNIQQDEGREVTIGFNNSEVFGSHGNTNFSAVVGQEVTEGETGRPGM